MHRKGTGSAFKGGEFAKNCVDSCVNLNRRRERERERERAKISGEYLRNTWGISKEYLGNICDIFKEYLRKDLRNT